MPSSKGNSQPRDRTCVTYVSSLQADSLPLVPPGKHPTPELYSEKVAGCPPHRLRLNKAYLLDVQANRALSGGVGGGGAPGRFPLGAGF